MDLFQAQFIHFAVFPVNCLKLFAEDIAISESLSESGFSFNPLKNFMNWEKKKAWL